MADIETNLEQAAQGAEAEYERRLEAEADAALDRIQRGQSWIDWLKISELFVHGRKQAMLFAHVNKPEGKGYNLWFSGWMARHPKLQAIDKATRSHCFQCYDNEAAITKWRATLAQNVREASNHPTAVIRRWKKEQAEVEVVKATARKSAREHMLEQVAVLEADNKKLRDKIEKGGENIFALSDTARNIAVALAGNLSVSKLADLAKELNNELAKRRKLEAEKKRAGPRLTA